MSEQVVAKRYADALFELGVKKDMLDVYLNDLHTVRDVFDSDERIIAFFNLPSINDKAKADVLEKSFEELHVDVLNTLKLLVERDRINLIQAIVTNFDQRVNERKGIAEAVVYSVRELSKSEQDELKITFAKRFNKNDLHLINVVDPEILGGMKVRVGNTIYDGTVKNKLKRLERNIVTANN